MTTTRADLPARAELGVAACCVAPECDGKPVSGHEFDSTRSCCDVAFTGARALAGVTRRLL